jgi:hypothetical protein
MSKFILKETIFCLLRDSRTDARGYGMKSPLKNGRLSQRQGTEIAMWIWRDFLILSKDVITKDVICLLSVRSGKVVGSSFRTIEGFEGSVKFEKDGCMQLSRLLFHFQLILLKDQLQKLSLIHTPRILEDHSSSSIFAV